VTFWISAAIFAVGGVVVGIILRPGVPDFSAVDDAVVHVA